MTCLEIVRKEREAGFEFDIVLMDYHMVTLYIQYIHMIRFDSICDFLALGWVDVVLIDCS